MTVCTLPPSRNAYPYNTKTRSVPYFNAQVSLWTPTQIYKETK